MFHILALPLLVLSTLTSGTPGPTLAEEDTMHTELPEILVSAPRVTLNEILDRVARGEARRDSMLRDQAFTATMRVVRGEGASAQLVREIVARVYRKRPNRVRTVVIRDRDERKKGARVGMNVEFRPEMSEEVVNFAFRPEARREFKYEIEARDVVGDHLIYQIHFEPRSTLDPWLPSGKVWVDTNEFVIVRQEAEFGRSPVPLFIRDIERMVIERQRVEGYWVLSRVLVRIATQFSFPGVGKGFDMSIRLDDYAINQGIEDRFFEEGR